MKEQTDHPGRSAIIKDLVNALKKAGGGAVEVVSGQKKQRKVYEYHIKPGDMPAKLVVVPRCRKCRKEMHLVDKKDFHPVMTVDAMRRRVDIMRRR